ncbi:hypothetical protein RN616_11135 [Morganella morganii]|uniref:hypothetical protein n=1 Tax=Morganella morganii TaxID=582 RepID=UPI0028D22134|nr:hypothetical protein [Morganella morganii]WNP29089.1 hypothetical protein RN616_11135 [Morganella morganii]
MNLFSNYIKIVFTGLFFVSFFSCAESDGYVCLNNGGTQLEFCSNERFGFDYRMLSSPQSLLISKNSLENERGTIYNYIKLPKNEEDILSFSNIASGLALLISIFVPVWQRRKQKDDNVNDGFWAQEIIIPKINKCIENTYTKAKGIGVNDQNELVAEIDALRESFTLIRVYPKSEDSFSTLNKICDDFEDAIFDDVNGSLNNISAASSVFYVNITKELIKAHKKVTL